MYFPLEPFNVTFSSQVIWSFLFSLWLWSSTEFQIFHSPLILSEMRCLILYLCFTPADNCSTFHRKLDRLKCLSFRYNVFHTKFMRQIEKLKNMIFPKRSSGSFSAFVWLSEKMFTRRNCVLLKILNFFLINICKVFFEFFLSSWLDSQLSACQDGKLYIRWGR